METRPMVVMACAVLATTPIILGIMWVNNGGRSGGINGVGPRSVAEQQSRQ